MSDPVGDRLRRLTTPPPVGDPVARVRARRARSDRRRGAAAVLTAVVAVASLAAGTQALRRDAVPVAEEQGVVPWALRLAPQLPFPAGPGPSGLPPCQAGDLTAAAEEPTDEPARDGRLPRVSLVVVVTNDGPPCQLEAMADGALVGEQGPLPLSSRSARSGPAFSPPPPLATGATASTELSWSSWCGADPGRWRVAVEVGDGSTEAAAPGADPPVPPCAEGSDAAVYGFGRWVVLNEAGQPALDPQSALVGSVTGPGSAPVGGVLPMVLRLANPTRGPIALDPCPQFAWSVDRRGPGSSLRSSPTLELNCADAPDAVPAGGHLDFALELVLSPALADGFLEPGTWYVTPGLGGAEPRAVTVLPAQEAPLEDPADCTWVAPPAADPRVAGLPPASAPRTTRTAVLETDRGEVVVELDGARAPCAVQALVHLAEGGFFDGQPCYELSRLPVQFRHLDCGANEADPVRAGFAFPTEARDGQDYPAGTVVLSSTETLTDAGSLRILYGAAPTYEDSFVVVGKVVRGLEVVEQVAAGGQTDGAYGPPRLPLTIRSVRID